MEEEKNCHHEDPHEKSHNDPVKGSLAECFADIYQDLKDFLLLYQKPLKIFKENAVRDCKRLFETRYGYRLLIAQAAVHCIQFPGSQDDTGDIFFDRYHRFAHEAHLWRANRRDDSGSGCE